MVLFINTTERDRLTVKLLHDGHVVAVAEPKAEVRHAQILLPTICMLLERQHVTMSRIAAIEVNAGPGSFTGTRVGVSVANALGLALGVPVNGLPTGHWVSPVYGEPPKMTKPSQRNST